MGGDTLQIAVLQSRRENEWRDSLRRVLSIVSRSNVEAEVLALSENWLSREPLEPEDYAYAVERVGEEFPGDILAGSNYVIEPGGPRSVGLALAGGRVVRACEKLFPSQAVGERARIAPGRLLPPVEVSGWRVHCVICVDLFYPEIARVGVLLGSEIIYNPASIPSDRIGLWKSLLLTRAAENTVFTVGVNGVSYVYPDGRITLGSSSVYAPNGIMIGGMGTGEGVSVFLLDKQVIRRTRERWAFYGDLAGSISRFVYGEPGRLVGTRWLASDSQ
ncbi:MAG: carbon-nitrogen hydrolase family protein [Desulfurococcales archaeon]|nr:carbon-nitrogen hydrolase family protein [Desulfurococcales archaeon]